MLKNNAKSVAVMFTDILGFSEALYLSSWISAANGVTPIPVAIQRLTSYRQISLKKEKQIYTLYRKGIYYRRASGRGLSKELLTVDCVREYFLNFHTKRKSSTTTRPSDFRFNSTTQRQWYTDTTKTSAVSTKLSSSTQTHVPRETQLSTE